MSKYGVLILGRDTLVLDSEVAGGADKILKFVKAGGTLFALAQNPATFKADWLPGKIAVRDMNAQFILKEKTTDPLLWGLSAFDLTCYNAHDTAKLNIWPDSKIHAEYYGWSTAWSSLLFVSKDPENWDIGIAKPIGVMRPTGGSAMLIAKHGAGKIILCQLALDRACDGIDEEDFEDMEIVKLAPRLLADILLTNLGVATAEKVTKTKPMAKVSTTRQYINMVTQLGNNKKLYPAAWKIIGPFDNLENKNFSVPQGPEADILSNKIPAENYLGNNDKKVSWKVITPDTIRDGAINLDRLFDRADWVTAYATMTIKSPTVRKVIFFIGSDDGYRLWLNGKNIADMDIARGSTPMQEVYSVDLKAGDNIVLLKITEQVGEFNFYFSMMAEDGSLLSNCTTVPEDSNPSMKPGFASVKFFK